MEKRNEAVYFQESPELIVNTLIVGADELDAMQRAAVQVKGVSLLHVPQEEAVEAYIRAAQERKAKELAIRPATVEAAVARAFSMGGAVVRLAVESNQGKAARRLEMFEQRVGSERHKGRTRRRA